jgi:hypothetical protein
MAPAATSLMTPSALGVSPAASSPRDWAAWRSNSVHAR